MTREVKVFEASVQADAEPFPFELVFKREDGSEERHRFDALANPGAGADLAVTSIIQYDQRGRQITDLNGIRRFFRRVLVGDGYERLDSLLDDPAVTVPMDMLADAFNWLLEEYTGRPTRQQRRSSGGSPRNGGGSTGSPRSTRASTSAS